MVTLFFLFCFLFLKPFFLIFFVFFCVYFLDDRAILFEKQRLRLRRSIQGLLPDSPIKGPITPGIPNTPDSNINQPQQSQLLTQQQPQQTPKRPSPTRSISNISIHSNTSKVNKKKSSQQQQPQPPPMRAGSISTLKSPYPSNTTTLLQQSQMTPTQSSKKPLYSWEVGSEMDDNSEASSGYYPLILRERIYTIEYGSFIPSNVRGVYLRENNETDEHDNNSEFSDYLPHTSYLSKPTTSTLKRTTGQSPNSSSPQITNTTQGYLDLQIIFSENEFNAFISRKNLTLKNKNFKSKIILEKHASKYTDAQCKESKYLRTQTPFIDHKRILKELYRPEQPTKWIDGKGFQLTNTRIEID